MPATTGMKGAGYYDQHSAAQMSSIQALQDWVDDAVGQRDCGQVVEPLDGVEAGR